MTPHCPLTILEFCDPREKAKIFSKSMRFVSSASPGPYLTPSISFSCDVPTEAQLGKNSRVMIINHMLSSLVMGVV